jgi:hypothetical protein
MEIIFVAAIDSVIVIGMKNTQHPPHLHQKIKNDKPLSIQKNTEAPSSKNWKAVI